MENKIFKRINTVGEGGGFSWGGGEGRREKAYNCN